MKAYVTCSAFAPKRGGDLEFCCQNVPCSVCARGTHKNLITAVGSLSFFIIGSSWGKLIQIWFCHNSGRQSLLKEAHFKRETTKGREKGFFPRAVVHGRARNLEIPVLRADSASLNRAAPADLPCWGCAPLQHHTCVCGTHGSHFSAQLAQGRFLTSVTGGQLGLQPSPYSLQQPCCYLSLENILSDRKVSSSSGLAQQ